MIEDSKKVLQYAKDQGIQYFCACVSGGKDSITALDVALKFVPIEMIVYIDTTIGVPDTKEFVLGLQSKYRIPVVILTPKKSFEEIVLKEGFPRTPAHHIIMIELKLKPLRSFKKYFKKPVAFISGTRKKESKKRMTTAKAMSEFDGVKFVAPLVNWSTPQVFAYLKKNNLEVAPAYKKIHLSGDCLCGANSQDAESEVISLFYPDIANQISRLECQLRKMQHPYWKWGNKGSMTGALTQKRLMPLCADCEI